MLHIFFFIRKKKKKKEYILNIIKVNGVQCFVVLSLLTGMFHNLLSRVENKRI